MNTDDFNIKQRLTTMRIELNAACHILKGDNLQEFKSIIAEIANRVGLKTTETGTFVKPEL
jgi:hypothetical protein